MKEYKVTLCDDSTCQDHEDSTFDVWVRAEDADEAAEKALIDERANVYVTAVNEAEHQ
jgi:hypothetical protein